MVVDGGWRQPLLLQGALPGNDIAAQASGDAVVPVALGEVGEEARQVQRDLLRHGRRTHPAHGQVEVARGPGLQTVWRLRQRRWSRRPDLSGSKFVEIHEVGDRCFRAHQDGYLPRWAILCSEILP